MRPPRFHCRMRRRCRWPSNAGDAFGRIRSADQDHLSLRGRRRRRHAVPALAQHFAPALDRTVIVENRTGGDGLIGIRAVKGASPDGATILVTTGPTMYLLPMVETEPSFDTAKDFVPVSLLARFEFAIVASPAIDAKDFEQFVAWLKANPDKATFGVPSNGTIPHFTGSQARAGARHSDDARALSRQRADHQRPDRRPSAVRYHHACGCDPAASRRGRQDRRGQQRGSVRRSCPMCRP